MVFPQIARQNLPSRHDNKLKCDQGGKNKLYSAYIKVLNVRRAANCYLNVLSEWVLQNFLSTA